ncbi:MAG TPA: S8 family serine peptidase, partial [Acidimicrobiia bacterium]|nr:S8 family serine peptidase [Acidimicrobiia bacterium]
MARVLITLVLLVGLLALPVPSSDVPAHAESTPESIDKESPPSTSALIPREVPDKPSTSRIPEGYSEVRIHLKLVEGSAGRLRDGAITAPGEDLADLNEILRGDPEITVRRLFTRPEAELSQEKDRIEARSGRQQADKNLYFLVELPEGSEAEGILDELNALDVVEIAYPEPLPQPPPVTPDFSSQQLYRNPAPQGIDVSATASIPGGQGENVKIIDIEYSWNTLHEDLGASVGTLIPNGTPCNPFPGDNLNHGTAVLGQLVGTDNGIGVIGIAHEADIGLVNAAVSSGGSCVLGLANAIDVAHNNLSAGDVILIEQQVSGPDLVCTGQGGNTGYVAVEWIQAYYDAIVAATSDGIIVVEAAGNGSCNYDSGAYGTVFPADRPNSKAIIVGAGASPNGSAPARSRLGFSGHGTRVDLQGYGEKVVTTGYGDLQGGSLNQFYTAIFSGTSSASPIVTGAAAILSSIAKENGKTLSPTGVRSLLKTRGTPQDTSSGGALPGKIGPLPDLSKAVLMLMADDLDGAIVLSGNSGSDSGTNAHATGESGEAAGSCVADSQFNSVWWSWTPSASGSAVIDTVGSGFDTTLAVYTGNTIGTLTEVPNGCNDDIDFDGGNLRSSVTIDVTGGKTYKIRVDGFNTSIGTVKLNYSLDADTSVAADTSSPTWPDKTFRADVFERTLTLEWKAASDNVGVEGYVVVQAPGTPVNGV